MNENKLKHLEFIQAVITRMNTNSFHMKGWAVTLVAALLALSTNSASKTIAVLVFIPIITFWILDSIILHCERRYRELFKSVAEMNESAPVDFNMDATDFLKTPGARCKSFFAPSNLLFYGILILMTILLIFVLKVPVTSKGG